MHVVSRDPEKVRWTRPDGAAALLGHITAHLLREPWWRIAGEWLGDEVIHGDQQETDQKKPA